MSSLGFDFILRGTLEDKITYFDLIFLINAHSNIRKYVLRKVRKYKLSDFMSTTNYILTRI